MKTIGVLFILGLSLFSVSTMVKTKVAEGITMSIPDTLYPMTPEDMALRFPSVRAPIGAFTNDERLVDFSVNISATQWPDGDTEIARKFFKSSLQNLYDRLDILSEGTQLLRKKKFIYFEFESRISGDRRVQGMQDPVVKYIYIQYLVLKERTLVFSFSCPNDRKEEWQPVAHEMMKSIRVK